MVPTEWKPGIVTSPDRFTLENSRPATPLPCCACCCLTTLNNWKVNNLLHPWQLDCHLGRCPVTTLVLAADELRTVCDRVSLLLLFYSTCLQPLISWHSFESSWSDRAKTRVQCPIVFLNSSQIILNLLPFFIFGSHPMPSRVESSLSSSLCPMLFNIYICTLSRSFSFTAIFIASLHWILLLPPLQLV